MLLMSKDTELAKFDNKDIEVLTPDLMPFALRHKGVTSESVYRWIKNRLMSIDRSNARQIISLLGLGDINREEWLKYCNGASLMDCYWVKEDGDNSKWGDINFYTNDFDLTIAKIALNGKRATLSDKNIITPELTTGGAYAKCWGRVNNKIYMFKGGSIPRVETEAHIEVLCSEILNKLNINHVKYTYETMYGRKVSKCECIANEKVSICSISEFMGYCDRNNISIQNWLQRKESYWEMLIADYILMNTDRHFNNWGIYFNSDTGQELGLHPLLDHNNSLVVKEKGRNDRSQAIPGKTLAEAARYAKSKCKVSTGVLANWLKGWGVKKRFKQIFNDLLEYNSLLERIDTYNKWKV